MKMKREDYLSSLRRRFIYKVSSAEAKAKIDKFRKTWNIDFGGFKNKKDYYRWIERAIKKPPVKLKEVCIWEITTHYEFFGNLYRRGKPKEKFKRISLKANKTKLFNENFNRAVSKLGVEIGIDNNWHYFFKNYLLFGDRFLGKIDDLGIKISKISKCYSLNKPSEEKFVITITPNTRREDIIRLWGDFIEKEKKVMVGFIKIPSNWKPKGQSQILLSKILSRVN